MQMEQSDRDKSSTQQKEIILSEGTFQDGSANESASKRKRNHNTRQ